MSEMKFGTHTETKIEPNKINKATKP
jgi:hypothetical protein